MAIRQICAVQEDLLEHPLYHNPSFKGFLENFLARVFHGKPESPYKSLIERLMETHYVVLYQTVLEFEDRTYHAHHLQITNRDQETSGFYILIEEGAVVLFIDEAAGVLFEKKVDTGQSLSTPPLHAQPVNKLEAKVRLQQLKSLLGVSSVQSSMR